jgi:hypothetical protein
LKEEDMGLNKQYIEDFFKQFKSIKSSSYMELYLKEAIMNFIKEEDKTSAFDVYTEFFDSCKIMAKGNANIIDLFDVLKYYEENASVLLDKQRDHYVHSVNVFLLGLSIYSQNENFRKIISQDHESNKGNMLYEEDIEEFLFQWGIASLCHDIGYPIEITYKQLKKFVDRVSDVEGKSISPEPYLGFNSFDALNSLPKKDNVNAINLLSLNIHNKFGISLDDISGRLNKYLYTMQENKFVDHGFYSAIILLKWYSYLVENNISEENANHPVVNAAGAILLHNYYSNGLMKKPFNLGALKPQSHPMAFLLILCDELQEWNREAYGIEDKKRVLADESRIQVSDKLLNIDYLAPKGIMESGFASKKESLMNKVLNLTDLFEEGLSVKCLASTDIYIETIMEQDAAIVPRPLLQNIEKIAKTIHEEYMKQQKIRNPDDKPIAPWDELAQDLKYSNLRQARSITDKLKRLGYVIAEHMDGVKEITELNHEQIEFLSKIEHDLWNEERLKNGWQYGPVKDTDKKISPYIVPYEELTEEIKDYDRDTVRNMIPLINSVGLKVYER